MNSFRGSPPKTPRWVKVFVIIAIVLVLLFVILQFISGGEHGPRRHIPSGGASDIHTLYSSVSEAQPLYSGDPGSNTRVFKLTEHGVRQL